MRKFSKIAILTTVAAGAILAQPGGPLQPGGDQDPPSRVARLNFLNGPVSFRPGSVDEWTAATLNYPLTTGDHLWTDAGAVTELHIGSTAIRLDHETAMSFLNLGDQTAQISLTQGGLEIRVRYLAENESIEVDTPNAAVSLLRPGTYRITADGDSGISVAQVRNGEAEVTAGGSAFPLRAGESARLAGMDNVGQDISAAAPPDAFDQWCDSRDRREDESVSARYVPREMIGYEDLDSNGVWSEMPQYGMVWRPRVVDVGWAPYREGHWAWVAPWGWTWIDDEPWGFAPFHYGRWAYASGAWFWVPGRMVVGVRPVYAPALVAFVGGGGFGVGVGAGGGMAAWFPLGPGEVYRPSYRVSEVYVRNMNIVHVRDVAIINQWNVSNARYANREIVGAVTVVPHDTFIHARRVDREIVVVPRETIVRASVIGTTAQVAPVRESVVVRPAVMVRTPPARVVERTVVVRNAPPPPPVSFAAQQQVLRNNGGRPLDAQQVREIRSTAPAREPMVRQSRPMMQPQHEQAQPRREEQQPQRFGRPPANDRPAAVRPAEQPRTVQPPAGDRPAAVRPVEQPRTVQPPPRQEQRTERPANNEHKNPPKREERTEKKGGL